MRKFIEQERAKLTLQAMDPTLPPKIRSHFQIKADTIQQLLDKADHTVDVIKVNVVSGNPLILSLEDESAKNYLFDLFVISDLGEKFTIEKSQLTRAALAELPEWEGP